MRGKGGKKYDKSTKLEWKKKIKACECNYGGNIKMCCNIKMCIIKKNRPGIIQWKDTHNK